MVKVAFDLLTPRPPGETALARNRKSYAKEATASLVRVLHESPSRMVEHTMAEPMT